MKSNLIKLYQHQKDGITFFKESKYKCALFFDMGLGKTLTALYCMKSIKNRINHVLVFCPKSVAHSWTKEIRKFRLANENLNIKCIDLTQLNSLTDRLSILYNSLIYRDNIIYIYICNYETLLGLDSTNKPIPNTNQLMIIYDESYYLKNQKAKRTVNAYKAFKDVPYKLLLSGAPVFEHPLDLFGQFYVLNEIFGSSYFKFRCEYFTSDYMGWNFALTEVGKKNILLKLKTCSIVRVTKECLDLPEAVYETRQFEANVEQRKQFKSLKELWKTTDGIDLQYALQIVNESRKVCSGIVTGKDNTAHIKIDKEDELIDIIKNNPKKKIVVWFVYNKTIKYLMKRLKKEKIKYVHFFGSDKIDNIDTYLTSKDIYVMLCQIKKGGVGLNLQITEISIFYEQPFSYLDKSQAIKRCAERIGQKHSCLIIDFLTSKTIEMKVFKLLREKRDFKEWLIENLK